MSILIVDLGGCIRDSGSLLHSGKAAFCQVCERLRCLVHTEVSSSKNTLLIGHAIDVLYVL